MNFSKVFDVLKNNITGPCNPLDAVVPSVDCFNDMEKMESFLSSELGDQFDSVIDECTGWIDKFNNKENFKFSVQSEVSLEYDFDGTILSENVDEMGYEQIDIGNMISAILYDKIAKINGWA